jgi:hypothetical protein
MINSLGGGLYSILQFLKLVAFLILETMTTSWSSSTDDHHHENISSSSTDKNEKPNHSNSEGSIFSDANLPAQEESNPTALVNFERGPSFLIPNV